VEGSGRSWKASSRARCFTAAKSPEARAAASFFLGGVQSVDVRLVVELVVLELIVLGVDLRLQGS